MKASLDASKCQGHEYCVKVAPSVFDLDEFGYSRVAVTGDLPEDAIADAQAAQRACPTEAIRLHSGT